jgi:hypothetical protein
LPTDKQNSQEGKAYMPALPLKRNFLGYRVISGLRMVGQASSVKIDWLRIVEW